jgi:rubrerythrin
MMNKSVKGTRTEKNLLAAFAGESQARNRYAFFAAQARDEGYEQIASIFEETADNERMHAKRYFRFLEGGDVEITASYPAGKVKTTIENLEQAAAGEHAENTEIYPTMGKIALEEGFPEIAKQFELVTNVEVQHEARYRKLIERLKSNTVFKRDTPVRWKCRKCGHIHVSTGPLPICPTCGHPMAYFEIDADNY